VYCLPELASHRLGELVCPEMDEIAVCRMHIGAKIPVIPRVPTILRVKGYRFFFNSAKKAEWDKHFNQ
jgi:hypothetical protein